MDIEFPSKKLLKGVLLVALLCAAIPASLADEKEVKELLKKHEVQIKKLKANMESLENAVYSLQQQLPGTKAEAKGGMAATGENAIDIPQALEGENQKSLVQPLAVNPEDSPAEPGQGTILEKEDAVKSRQDRRDYDAALATLKGGKFAEAEQQFSDFLVQYPQSQLQSNAIFWYAESFFRREVFNKAAVYYLKGYKQYPTGAKAADSLLKLSLALEKLHKPEEACNMLVKLDAEFPNRPMTSVTRAREAIGRLRCKNLPSN